MYTIQQNSKMPSHRIRHIELAILIWINCYGAFFIQGLTELLTVVQLYFCHFQACSRALSTVESRMSDRIQDVYDAELDLQDYFQLYIEETRIDSHYVL